MELSAPSDNSDNDETQTSVSSLQMPVEAPQYETENLVENESEEENDGTTDDQEGLRKGTITSARFNILSTMVGGGSLSIPLAFHQSGKAFLAPILLLSIGMLSNFSIRFLVHAANMTTKRTNPDELGSRKKGTVSYESVACEALGPKARYLSMGLVSTICFFTIAGYGVLLRDMLLPLSDYISPSSSDAESPNGVQNMTMLAVILLITPLCTLQDLTALQNIGAASMLSVLTLSLCITYRSAQCNFSSQYDHIRHMPWYEYMTLLPPDQNFTSSAPSSTSTPSYIMHELLNALPILVNVFACHFNVLPIHNELKNPTPKRVSTLIDTSLFSAAAFYLFMGFSGSMYGNCTPSGMVEGNVLLSFVDEGDRLLLLGRGCLSLTIAFAFPVFVVPARDVILRGWEEWEKVRVEEERRKRNEYVLDDDGYDGDVSLGGGGNLAEPLLTMERDVERSVQGDVDMNIFSPKARRIVVSISILWMAAMVSCCVKNIDIVWDILGGSFALMIMFIIPSSSYLILTKQFERGSMGEEEGSDGMMEERDGVSVGSVGDHDGDDEVVLDARFKRIMAWSLIFIFIPFMIICTSNAIYNIFAS